jgi:hypothetical protein
MKPIVASSLKTLFGPSGDFALIVVIKNRIGYREIPRVQGFMNAHIANANAQLQAALVEIVISNLLHDQLQQGCLFGIYGPIHRCTAKHGLEYGPSNSANDAIMGNRTSTINWHYRNG